MSEFNLTIWRTVFFEFSTDCSSPNNPYIGNRSKLQLNNAVALWLCGFAKFDSARNEIVDRCLLAISRTR